MGFAARCEIRSAFLCLPHGGESVDCVFKREAGQRGRSRGDELTKHIKSRNNYIHPFFPPILCF